MLVVSAGVRTLVALSYELCVVLIFFFSCLVQKGPRRKKIQPHKKSSIRCLRKYSIYTVECKDASQPVQYRIWPAHLHHCNIVADRLSHDAAHFDDRYTLVNNLIDGDLILSHATRNLFGIW